MEDLQKTDLVYLQDSYKFEDEAKSENIRISYTVEE